MSPAGTVKLLVTANVVVLGIGVVDAGFSAEWDLFSLLLIGLAISLTLLFHLESRRPAIPVRRDLVVWLLDRSSISGESLSAVTDRAIATFADRYGAVMNVEETRQ